MNPARGTCLRPTPERGKLIDILGFEQLLMSEISTETLGALIGRWI
jgi:hypothetical protein